MDPDLLQCLIDAGNASVRFTASSAIEGCVESPDEDNSFLSTSDDEGERETTDDTEAAPAEQTINAESRWRSNTTEDVSTEVKLSLASFAEAASRLQKKEPSEHDDCRVDCHDKERPPKAARCSSATTALPDPLGRSSGSGSGVDDKPSVKVSPLAPRDFQLKPLRMTLQVDHRSGDVCYARVPSTGQVVAGRIPPSLSIGDRFLVMYRPKPSVMPAKSPSVQPVIETARYSYSELPVPRLVALLRATTWTGDEPPVRPLRLQDPLTRVIFRESSIHKRRQKREVGPIDKWKNTGGKRAITTTSIPTELCRSRGDVLVSRSGKVIRVDGVNARYKQWSFGTVLANGDLRERRTCQDNILFQLCPLQNASTLPRTQEQSV
jgi:hypothetical protein